MKVGILTMHRVINYGSFLQAYALKQLVLLNRKDANVSFIDIKPGKPLAGFEIKNESRIVKDSFLSRFVKYLIEGELLHKAINHRHLIRRNKYYKSMIQCIEQNLPLLGIDSASEGHKYDLVIIGSDEVFNCCQLCSWGFTLQLYGEIPEACRVISFAGSFGHTQYEQLTEHNIDLLIAETMKSMSAISVRDKNSFEIVKRLTNIKPSIHLDPVLVYGYQNEIKRASPPKDKSYIIIYSYLNRITNTDEVKEILQFARKHHKRLYSFTYYKWCDKTIMPSSPFEVLNWFKGADYVITDTFHGTIFSIITHRPFITLIRPSNRNKIMSLLIQLELRERGAEHPGSIESILSSEVDFINVDSIISQGRKNANQYLFSHLSHDRT